MEPVAPPFVHYQHALNLMFFQDWAIYRMISRHATVSRDLPPPRPINKKPLKKTTIANIKKRIDKMFIYKRCAEPTCTSDSNNTPQWRKGPLGPQTLCNRCGLKYNKQMKRLKDDKMKKSWNPTQKDLAVY
jgi:hypothetical protein